MTVAVGAGASCGGTTAEDTDSTGGHSSDGGVQDTGEHSTGGTGGHLTGGTHMGGTHTGGTTDIRLCTGNELYFGNTCDKGDECLIDMGCTSGKNRTMLLRCGTYGWSPVDRECENPSEECSALSARARCDGENWYYHGGGGNPPAPCPLEKPEDGSTCRFGYDFGADPTACGYPCDEGGWTIVGCEAIDDAPEIPRYGAWESDGVCSQGGAGGEVP